MLLKIFKIQPEQYFYISFLAIFINETIKKAPKNSKKSAAPKVIKKSVKLETILLGSSNYF